MKTQKIVMSEFYCQREIECNTPCETQCDHCKEYYKPIEPQKYKGYIIEPNEYPHTKLRYQATPIEYTGCETIFHGKTIDNCKQQIEDYEDN